MTNPDREELVKLESRIQYELVACETLVRAPTLLFSVDDLRLILRRLASSDGGVKVRESVKRYCIHYDARGEYEHPKGDFVHWSDYQSLAQKYDALITAQPADAGMREALEDIETLGRHLRNGGPDPMDLQELSTALSDAVDFASGALLAEQALTAPGATTKSDGDCLGSLPSGESEPAVTSAWSPSDPSSTRATASFQGEDAVERVELPLARAINDVLNAMVDAQEEMTTTKISARILGDDTVRAILATGLVPDESAVRADEREKCAEIADCLGDEYDATSFASTNADQVAALRSKEQAAHEIAAAIRSNRGEA